MAIEPFRIAVSDEVLLDLRQRLASTRWPDQVTGAGWDYGVEIGYLRELVAYWLDGYDWRAQEAMLNRFAQFRAEVGGQQIHFIHERGRGPRPLPLLITHGWPGSFFEMYRVVEPLADPATFGGDPGDAFDVIVPSLPGYGFSDAPTEPGVGPGRTVELWAALMTELGYERFGAQGGDWGAMVTSGLGLRYPDRLLGMHFNMIGIGPSGAARRPINDEERAFFARAAEWRKQESHHGAVQGSRPQTLGYALTDSPVGLAAWILERWRSWSDCGGNVEQSFSKDEILTNISIYWFSNTANSAGRFYYEASHGGGVGALPEGQRMKPAAGFAVFPREPLSPPRSWVERAYDVRHWTEMPQGGHFAALEEPELFVEDVRAFFRPLRSRA